MLPAGAGARLTKNMVRMASDWVASAPEVDPDETRRCLQALSAAGSAVDLGVGAGGRLRWHRSSVVRPPHDMQRDPLGLACPLAPTGQPVVSAGHRVLVYRQVAADGCVFAAQVTEVRPEREGAGAGALGLLVAWVTPPRRLYRYQRREALRVVPRPALEASVAYGGEGTLGSELTCVVEDLSVSGACLRADEVPALLVRLLRHGHRVSVSFRLGGEEGAEPEELSGEIVRLEREKREGGRLWLAVEWRSMTPSHARALSRYVVETERERLRARSEAREPRGWWQGRAASGRKPGGSME